ncbi:uncharacterized protein METZ01_LOCUS277334 [marine metagenome]|uniref:Uncharacterized protein n=1 Tax=marine metagenome TaxID=408172 RepID=A0A382KJ47_9ZZZZ
MSALLQAGMIGLPPLLDTFYAKASS